MPGKKLHIGTSGWHYKHWIGTFYPGDTKEADQLSHYTQSFNTVEINNSFYHLPDATTFKHWAAATPKQFLFAIKASRYITHMKKLSVGKREINKLLTRISKLKDKAGPILFQLPPKWNVNTQRLESFLTILPPTHRYAFEFRNSSWYCEEVYTLLKQYNCAFCMYELAGHHSPEMVTADFVYVRLHGPSANKYQGSYHKQALHQWASKCKIWISKRKEVYVYFDNDQQGFAAANAITLMELTNHVTNRKKA